MSLPTGMMPFLAVVLAYLVGGIPFGYLLVKMKTGEDVRAKGSGNIGATNVLRTTGRLIAVITLLLDIAKGFFAVWLAAKLSHDSPWCMSAAALAMMAGHAYPIYLRFRGGKAVASFIGAFLYLTPIPLAKVGILLVIGGLADTRVNDIFLPGYRLPANVEPVSDLGLALADANVVLGVMPSRFARPLYRAMLPHLESGMRFVSATKGLETGSLLRMSEVAREVISEKFEPRIAVLSGPTFAREVASGEPTALVIASVDQELAASIQREFSGPTFRLYTNDDPIGVEIGAALKNTIAIGAGICQGLGLGNNPMAALITRGLVAIKRLAGAMSGQAPTMPDRAALCET